MAKSINGKNRRKAKAAAASAAMAAKYRKSAIAKKRIGANGARNESGGVSAKRRGGEEGAASKAA
jgi:hypothetical protein